MDAGRFPWMTVLAGAVLFAGCAAPGGSQGRTAANSAIPSAPEYRWVGRPPGTARQGGRGHYEPAGANGSEQQTPGPGRSAIQQAGCQEEVGQAGPDLTAQVDGPAPGAEPPYGADPQLSTLNSQPSYPINLPTALALAGANNIQIAVATERIREAAAQLDEAEVLWVPNISAGVSYNHHEGRIQDTRGDVIEVSRGSLFAGGGAMAGGAPAGGAGGPARLGARLNLSDAIFEPLAARQVFRATAAGRNAVFNDTLLAVALAYQDLLEAHADLANARADRESAAELVRLVELYLEEPIRLATPADLAQAQAERAARERNILEAEERVAVASAELARLLRLEPGVVLEPLDEAVLPLELVATDVPVDSLISQAVAARPEAARAALRVAAAGERRRQEQWRPWLPSLMVGVSAGGFGGAPGGEIDDFSDRADFDALAVWELQNGGLGWRARIRQRDSETLQARLESVGMRDRIGAEVAAAYHLVVYRRQRIDEARSSLEAAAESYRLALERVRLAGEVGDLPPPIEALGAIQALAGARRAHVEAVIDYNRAQFSLLRAIGRPPTMQ